MLYVLALNVRTYFKLLLIKASSKCPECKCECNKRFLSISHTCSMAGKKPVLTSPNKGLMISITAIIWQKYIMSAVVWNVS